MALEINLDIAATYSKNNANVTFDATYYCSVAGNFLEANSAYTATTADTALPLGGVTNPRWLWIQNMDPTNYVSVKTAVGGTEFARLLPGPAGILGDPMLIPLAPGITAPSVQANTASCVIQYYVFST